MFNTRVKVKDLLAMDPQGQEVIVMGWVRTFRNNQFIALNDGSTNNNVQVVAELGLIDEATIKRVTSGASIKVTGQLIQSLGKGQKVEVKAKNIEIFGDCNPEIYPLQLKNRPSLDFLREIAHLRFRTNTFGAVFRIRHSLAFAVHKFFNDKGFIYLHTPIISSSDAEGAGEMFRVTTLPIKNSPLINEKLSKSAENYYNQLIIRLKEKEFDIDSINERIKKIDIKNSNWDFKKIIVANDGQIRELKKLKLYFEKDPLIIKKFEEAYQLLEGFLYESIDNIDYYGEGFKKIFPSKRKYKITRRMGKDSYPYLCLSLFNFYKIDRKLRNDKESKLDFEQDFFGKSTNLTVSGQLEGELGAMAFSEIYTFGPTFRAENSNTTRHLAEFWMIEPEMAFYDLEDNMNLAEDFIRYIIKYAMEHCREDLDFLAQRLVEEEKQLPQEKRSELGLIEKLEFVINNHFERLTYTEAIDILKESNHSKKKKFQYPITGWGMDLQSEHERYLVEKHFKKPVILNNYPKEIKAFYMRQNEDGKTVAAMDILAPGIGEIVGGSQREERLEKLETRMKEMHIPIEEMWWYLDTRRFGTVPHAGFGLGFERMVQFVTGMTNIRDVIAFPRTPKNAEF